MIKVLGEIRPDKKLGNKVFYFRKPKLSTVKRKSAKIIKSEKVKRG